MSADARGEPMASEDLLSLPGPRRHLARLQEDLWAGLGCLWILPDPEIDSGRAEKLLNELLSTLDDVVEVPGTSGAAGQSPLEPAAHAIGSWESSHTEFGPSDGGFDYDDGFGDWGQLSAASARTDAPAPVAKLTASSINERLAKEMGLAGDPVAGLTDAAHGRAPIVVVRAWHEDDSAALSRLLRRLQAAVKDAGIPPSHRPRLLITARLDDLAVDALESLDPALYRPHWWWSVWSRLDTATLVAYSYNPTQPAQGWNTATGRILEAVRCETVTEVCGPDLPLATRLADAWDGAATTLAAALAACRPAIGSPVRYSGNAAAAYTPAPEPSLRPAWAAGLLDSWEGQVRCTPVEWVSMPDGRKHLDKLVWQAQNRVLLPLIDDARAQFIALLPQAAVRGVRHLANTYIDHETRQGNGTPADLASMELGEIWTAVKRRDIRFTITQRTRLGTLRSARNKLAHRCPLDDEGLMGLVEALTG